jgi:hypothetical protein
MDFFSHLRYGTTQPNTNAIPCLVQICHAGPGARARTNLVAVGLETVSLLIVDWPVLLFCL